MLRQWDFRITIYAAVVCDAPVRDDSSWMITSIWTLFSFAFTSVVLRFISRTPYFGVRLGWDDWTILILLVLQIPLNITIHYCVRNGFGQDIWMLEEYQIVAIFKYYFAGELIYLLGVSLLKISVLLQYLRIFNFRIWAYSLMVLSTSYGTAFIIATLASCRPFNYFFHRWQAEYSGTCISIYHKFYASVVINIIADGIITLLPITQIANLQMTFKKKLVVAFIFLAGFVVTGISIARFVVFKQANQANFTYSYIGVSILSVAELNIAIVCASVPAVVSLIRWLNGKRNTTKDSYGTPGGSTAIGPRFNADRKKGSRDRWHGFTDVFSTYGTATLVSSQPRSIAQISNDEFELLEDSIAEESSPQTSSHNEHSRSSDQATDHGPQVDNETPFYGVYPGRTM
ncbi:hypothetical protein N8I77_005319 [Diaporthe amygdali]|uniref:Rhodopsin domain-containing protein n=1 Tax=Phomopsis amygdali TaxID=1214568 RepID=A0AAD9W398_PHOAM|nr:hypothetical protein N8I77_005319 [Diaporthe amygdali]